MNLDAFFAQMGEIGPIVIVIGAVIAVLFLVFGLAEAANGPEKRKRARVDGLRSRYHEGPAVQQAANVSLKRDTSFSRVKAIDKLIRTALPRPDIIRQRLMRTGKKIQLGHYLMANGFFGLVAFGGAIYWFNFSPALAAMVGVAGGFGLPHFAVGFLVGRRQTKFLNNFPEAIDLMVRGLKSGLPITETIVTVGQEMRDPVGTEFQTIAQSIRLGQNPEEAVWAAANRVGLQELSFFVTALSVQRETGGNLTETLENLADVLRKRRQMKLKVRAMSSEARASAMIIGSLPFIMFVLIYLVNQRYIMMLFNDPRGMVITGIGLGLMVVGGIIMAKMVRFEI